MFQWAYLFFRFGEWACEPIFQTLSQCKFVIFKTLESISSIEIFNVMIFETFRKCTFKKHFQLYSQFMKFKKNVYSKNTFK